MTAAGKLWRWGIVVPATLAAFAGAIADVITGTMTYWWLIAPSYPVIAIATWRSLDPERQRAEKQARYQARIAELDHEIAVLDAEAAERAAKKAADPEDDNDLEDDSGLEDDDDLEGDDPTVGGKPAADDPLITAPPRVTVGSVAGGVADGFVRLLGAFVLTFLFMVMITAAIMIATWAKPFWYVYVPVLALIAGLALWFWRAEASAAEAATGAAKGRDPLVR